MHDEAEYNYRQNYVKPVNSSDPCFHWSKLYKIFLVNGFYLDCSQLSFCRIFILPLNTWIDSRENMTPAQNVRLVRCRGRGRGQCGLRQIEPGQLTSLGKTWTVCELLTQSFFTKTSLLIIIVPRHWKEHQSRYPGVDACAVLVGHSSCPGHGVLLSTVSTPPPDSTICVPCSPVLPARRHIAVHTSAGTGHALWCAGLR